MTNPSDSTPFHLKVLICLENRRIRLNPSSLQLRPSPRMSSRVFGPLLAPHEHPYSSALKLFSPIFDKFSTGFGRVLPTDISAVARRVVDGL